MAAEHTLWIQKEMEGSKVKSSLAAFGFAVREIEWPDVETQDVATREWPGEHGEDSYIPAQGLTLKAYDISVQFCYKGEIDTAYPAYIAFRNYLTGIDGSGGVFKIYEPYARKGRKSVHVKKFDNVDFHRSNADEALLMQVAFRVADPVTEIRPGTGINGEIVSLVEYGLGD